jgi:transcriptional regulator with XRE-family HTH domain
MPITAAQLKAARAQVGWSQEDLASVADVEVLTIVNFENGKSSPADPVLNDIRIALEAAGADLAASRRLHTAASNQPVINDEPAVPPTPPDEPYDGSPL